MKCFNCEEEINPTLLYCNSCGVPLETEPEDLHFDAEEKARERRGTDALQKARALLILTLFLFGVAVAVRMIFLRNQTYDHFPAYRVPYSVVAEEGLEPPTALDVPVMPIPLPQ